MGIRSSQSYLGAPSHLVMLQGDFNDANDPSVGAVLGNEAQKSARGACLGVYRDGNESRTRWKPGIMRCCSLVFRRVPKLLLQCRNDLATEDHP